ncbi:unnamed protein product [Phytophthora lilii]|uniref:Unnamed protein product n=1 Tax=Phytophthora lilii TaxID=2077276 RepID=A0A9W6UE43_9STRA|nr:unnamed protein product [Phytophthora lilii]
MRRGQLAIDPGIICNGELAFQSLASHILSGGTPDKPTDMTDSQWQLVKRMCSYDPRDRISASDVVRELEAFTTNFIVLHDISVGLSEIHDVPLTWANLGDYVVEV